jgi:hypothetical protein
MPNLFGIRPIRQKSAPRGISATPRLRGHRFQKRRVDCARVAAADMRADRLSIAIRVIWPIRVATACMAIDPAIGTEIEALPFHAISKFRIGPWIRNGWSARLNALDVTAIHCRHLLRIIHISRP